MKLDTDGCSSIRVAAAEASRRLGLSGPAWGAYTPKIAAANRARRKADA